MIEQAASSVQGLAHPGAGPHVQGELPRPAQHQGRRHRARAREATARRSTSTIRGSTRDEAEHEYGIRPDQARCARAATTRSCWRSAHQAVPRAWASTASARFARSTHVLYDIKYVFAADRGRRRGCRTHEDSGHRRRRLHRLSHVAQSCSARGDEVVGLDNLNDYYDSDAQARAPRACSRRQPSFRFVKLDLADRGGMAALFAREKFQRVIHLGRAGRRALLAREPARLRRQQRDRHAERARGLPAQRRRASGVTPRRARSTAPTRRCRSRCTRTSTIRCRSTPRPRRPTS